MNKLTAIFGVLFLAVMLFHGPVQAQVPDPTFKSIVWYDIWSYDQYPPHRMQYNGVTDLVMFGGGTAGVEPSTTAPYFPMRNYTSFAYTAVMEGNGWAPMSKYFPGTTKKWINLIRDSCNAHGVNLILDLGGEWGGPATAFNNLIANPSRWETYFTAVDEVCLTNPAGIRFDGVSLDIEWLNTDNAQGRQQFADFIAALRVHLDAWPGKPGRLGMATAMWWLWSDNPSTPYMASVTANKFNWLFEMCYNTFTSRVGSETQLFKHPSISGVEVVNDRATTQAKNNGVDPGIVILGTSFEVLQQNVAAGAKYGDPASGSTTASGAGSIVNQIFDQAQLDPISKSSFCIVDTKNYSFVTTASTQELIKLAQANGLGGVGGYSTFASNSGTGATSVNKPLNAYQNVVASVIGNAPPPPPPPPPAVDTVKPLVSISNPANGSNISGMVAIQAAASDNVAVTKVEFYVGAAMVSSDATSPYSYSWNTSALSGVQSLSARAYDAAGNVGASQAIGVTIVTAPPPTTRTGTLTLSQAILSAGQTLSITGWTSVAATSFDVWIDGKWWKWNGTVPFVDTISTFAAGTHTITGYVKWTDNTWSAQIVGGTITVTATPPPPPPSSCMTQAQVDSASAAGFALGVKSVICPPVIDTTGFWAKYFDTGWNAYFNTMPSSTTGQVTLTGQATLPVPKPAKR